MLGGLGNAGLDALGAIPGEAAAAVIVRAGVTSIQATSAILNANKGGGALTATGFANQLAGAAVAGPKARGALSSVEKAVAQGVPILGWAVTAVSLGKDAYDAYQAYQDCNNLGGK